MKLPVAGVTCWFAERLRFPSMVVMLDPDERVMLRAAVSEIPPVPLADTVLVALGRVIAPDAADAAVAVRLLLSAIVTDWLNAMPAPVVSERSEVGVSAALTVMVPLLASPIWRRPAVIRS